MKEYLNALKYVLTNGKLKQNRTGIDTLSVFGYQMRFDLNQGFPAVTTKKLAWRAVVSELLWMLEGSSDERRLCEILHGTRDNEKKTIWTANANADYWLDQAKYPGDCGRIYGKQMRDWKDADGKSVDQIQNLIDNIKQNPSSRRHILLNYNPGELDKMCLPPCHAMSQFDVTDGKLSCQLYQRSADLPLGVPFNIASYSLLTHMIAHVCNLSVGEFILTLGDTHIYTNQINGVQLQLEREPYSLAKLWLNPDCKNIFNFTMNDIKLIDYQSHPTIAMDMTV